MVTICNAVCGPGCIVTECSGLFRLYYCSPGELGQIKSPCTCTDDLGNESVYSRPCDKERDIILLHYEW